MSLDLSEFHDVFFEECSEGLDVMESGLVGLDENSDVEEINAIFRAAHSIKGGGASFGFMEISNFTHVMETLLDEMRDGRRPVESRDVDVLLSSVDVLRGMIDAAKEDGEASSESTELAQKQLEEALARGSADSGQADDGDAGDRPTSADEPKNEDVTLSSSESDSTQGGEWHINFEPAASVLVKGQDPVSIIEELQKLGDVKVIAQESKLPSVEEMEPELCYLQWQLHLISDDACEGDIKEVFAWLDDDSGVQITRAVATTEDASQNTSPNEPSAKPPEPKDVCEAANEAASVKPATPEKSTKKPAANNKDAGGSIRVATDKVDELINMVGELVITQSMLSEIGRSFDEVGHSELDKLRDGLSQLERNTRELQESVLQIRMLPVSFSFSRFPRLVRDLSGKLGKKIELKMTGEQTEVDKTVLEKIGDPLVHLVRNSIDHGIEMPQERAAAGKDETGTLELQAYHEGGDIVIKVIDDGAGLNRERILAKAVEKGLVEEGEEISDERVYNLIFAAGFSTAQQLSDVSGRGVGMDVVRRNVRDLGGNVSIASNEGAGSTVTIRLPLTLAILDGQLIRVGGQTYIVSLVSIVESLMVRAEDTSSIAEQSELYRLRDEYIPVIRVDQLFGGDSERSELAGGLLMIVESDGKRFGLVVDELLGQQQVVIKSLETNFRQVQGISGATILGDGTVSLIIDVPGLIARHSDECRSFERDLNAVA